MKPRLCTRVAAVVLAVLAGSVVIVAAPRAAAQAPPSVRVDRTGTAAGETLGVVGEGWPEGAVVLIELCGRAALGGSVDCDVANGRLVIAGADGKLFAPLEVGLPPQPCPCVVRAVDQSTSVLATTPIAVQGLPTVPLDSTEQSPLPIRVIEVTDVGLERTAPVASWFGGRARWTLTFTLRNVGTVDLREPALSIAVGKQTDPSGLVDAPDVGTLAPGEERTFTVPVRTEPFAFGGYTVKIEAHGFAEPVVARAHAATYPWGLLVIALLALQVALVVARNRVRRRLTAEPSAVAVTDEAVPVLDLTEPALELDAPPVTARAPIPLPVAPATEPAAILARTAPAPEVDETDAEGVTARAPIPLPPAPPDEPSSIFATTEPAPEVDETDADSTIVEAPPPVTAVPAVRLETARALVDLARSRSERADELVASLRSQRDAIAAGYIGISAWSSAEPADLATRLRCLADELSDLTGLAVTALKAAIDALDESAAEAAELAGAASRHLAALLDELVPEVADIPPEIDLRHDREPNGEVAEPPDANDFLSQRIHEAVTRALRS
jgi:hypothetical protein